MSDTRIMTLTKKGNELYLNNMKLTGWENYRIIQDSALPTGKAELEIKLIVEFPDNTQGQNPEQD